MNSIQENEAIRCVVGNCNAGEVREIRLTGNEDDVKVVFAQSGLETDRRCGRFQQQEDPGLVLIICSMKHWPFFRGTATPTVTCLTLCGNRRNSANG